MEDKQIFVPKDSLVKIYFKNGTVIEGIVLTWSDKKGLLRSLSGDSRMIIYNPIENVMMIKLLPTNEEEVTYQEPVKVKQITPPVDLVDSSPPKLFVREAQSDRVKRLVDDRLSKVIQEKKSIAQALEQSISSPSTPFYKQPPKVETTYYESPNFSKRRTILGTRKKNN